MDDERWQRIEEVFHSALDCPPEQRSAFLDSACNRDKLLREEVESLLTSYDDQRFTGSPAFAEALKLLDPSQSLAGRHIGPYRILREIGEGGMGAVYLAARSDDVFQKQVAIKILPRGLPSDVIRHFRSERQILAGLEHPNITRILDGGATDDGLLYFVMEYVNGQPIDKYCDEHKLSIVERLQLFRMVCAAVHYAHQNLIIHRDIKPGNVLVTADGMPMLLDFGIAKLLAADTLEESTATLTAARCMTPAYASPEQVRGNAVTTATDVYSLGVLLYELLAGHRPYELTGKSAAEVDRIICHDESAKPSAAADPGQSRRLRGDLDNIVLKAVRKEPRRRYGSVEQFSEDIRRHLDGLPVIARPDTPGYRTAKFIQRNKAWVAMGAVTFFALTSGIAVSLWQTHIARQQRDLARVEQTKAKRINEFLLQMVNYSGVAGGTGNQKYNATVAEMLDDAAKRVNELDDQPAVKADLLATIGTTYTSQARFEQAGHYLQEAYDLNSKIYGPDGLRTANVMQWLANLAYQRGDSAGAERWSQKALPTFRKHVNDADFEIRSLEATLSDAAFVERGLGKYDEAEALWREALAYAPRLSAKYRPMGIACKTYLAQLYVDRGDVEKADTLASEASQELRAQSGNPFGLAQSLIDLGNVRRLEGRYSEAEPLIQEGTKLYAQLQGDDHPNVAYGLWILSTLHYYEGRYDLAEQDARRELKIVEKLPNGTRYYSAAYSTLGRVLNKTGRSREAEPMLREALAIRQKYPRRGDVAIALGDLGECLMTQKRYAEAEPLLKESYETLRSVQVPHSPVLKEALVRLDSLYAAWGKAPVAGPR